MSEQKLNFDEILEDVLLSKEKVANQVRAFGLEFRDEANTLYDSLPEGVYENIYISGEIIDIAKDNEQGEGQFIYTSELYHFGGNDEFLDKLQSGMEELGYQINQEKKTALKDYLKSRLGNLAEYDMPDLYDEIKKGVEEYIDSSTQTMGRMQNYISPDMNIVLGEDQSEDLKNDFLIRVANPGFVGKLFVVPKGLILDDPKKAKSVLINAITDFTSQGAEAINESI